MVEDYSFVSWNIEDFELRNSYKNLKVQIGCTSENFMETMTEP